MLVECQRSPNYPHGADESGICWTSDVQLGPAHTAWSNVPEHLVDVGSQVELLAHPAHLAAVDIPIAFDQLQHVASVTRPPSVELQGDEMRYIDHGQVVARNACSRSLDGGLPRLAGDGLWVVEIDYLHRIETVPDHGQDSAERIVGVGGRSVGSCTPAASETARCRAALSADRRGSRCPHPESHGHIHGMPGRWRRSPPTRSRFRAGNSRSPRQPTGCVRSDRLVQPRVPAGSGLDLRR